MSEFQNNVYFWQKIDSLVLSGDFVTLANKGDVHPDYPALIYPLRYGYLQYLNSEDMPSYRVYKGEHGSSAEALVVCADILSKSIDVKILIGCDEQEEEDILRFLNQSEFQKTVVLHRGNQIPSWVQSE